MGLFSMDLRNREPRLLPKAAAPIARFRKDPDSELWLFREKLYVIRTQGITPVVNAYAWCRISGKHHINDLERSPITIQQLIDSANKGDLTFTPIDFYRYVMNYRFGIGPRLGVFRFSVMSFSGLALFSNTDWASTLYQGVREQDSISTENVMSQLIKDNEVVQQAKQQAQVRIAVWSVFKVITAIASVSIALAVLTAGLTGMFVDGGIGSFLGSVLPLNTKNDSKTQSPLSNGGISDEQFDGPISELDEDSFVIDAFYPNSGKRTITYRRNQKIGSTGNYVNAYDYLKKVNDILILGNKVFTQKGELVNITILSDEDIAKADLSYGSRVYQGAIGKVSEDSFTFITDNEEIVVKYTPGQMINTDYNTKSSSKSAFQELAGRRLELVTSRDMVFVAFKFYNTPSQAN